MARSLIPRMHQPPGLMYANRLQLLTNDQQGRSANSLEEVENDDDKIRHSIQISSIAPEDGLQLLTNHADKVEEP